MEDAEITLNDNGILNCFYTLISPKTFLAAQFYNSTEVVEDTLLVTSNGENPKGRYKIDITEMNGQSGVATLTIASAMLSDQGYYQCRIVDNDYIIITGVGKLDVYYIDEVMAGIDSYSNSSFTMTCSGSGNPVPRLNLYQSGSIIMTNTTTMLTHTRNPVSENDNGEYYCEATNTAGTVKSNEITLRYYIPKFDSLPEYMIVESGDDVVIAINSMSANPSDVSYQWAIDDPDIRDTDTNPSTFSFMVPADGGKSAYVISVNVTNTIGSKTESITIIVSVCNCSSVSESCDESSKDLTVVMVFVGIIIGGFGVIVGQVGYTKIKQNKLTENKGERKAEKKKQEMYMEYMSEPSNPTYQDLQHRVQEESAYVNVKKAKNSKT